MGKNYHACSIEQGSHIDRSILEIYVHCNGNHPHGVLHDGCQSLSVDRADRLECDSLSPPDSYAHGGGSCSSTYKVVLEVNLPSFLLETPPLESVHDRGSLNWQLTSCGA